MFIELGTIAVAVPISIKLVAIPVIRRVVGQIQWKTLNGCIVYPEPTRVATC